MGEFLSYLFIEAFSSAACAPCLWAFFLRCKITIGCEHDALSHIFPVTYIVINILGNNIVVLMCNMLRY